jgi:hypothetical protein
LLTVLDTPYADTRAAALSFALGLPRLDALAVLPVAAPTDGTGRPHLELRLLGASHQVFAGTFSETVACLPGENRPVPARHHGTAMDGWDYEFESATVAHDREAEFRQAVEELRDLLAGRDDALTGTFPGSPHAVTALLADLDDTVGWRTWHAYPQTLEIVMTRSRLVSAR